MLRWNINLRCFSCLAKQIIKKVKTSLCKETGYEIPHKHFGKLSENKAQHQLCWRQAQVYHRMALKTNFKGKT